MPATCTLPISDRIYLTHSLLTGEGKTTAMAKGPFLCCEKTMYSGESAGFGLPVLKTPTLTFFPTIIALSQISSRVLEVNYRFNLILKWRFWGIAVPAFFNTLAEKLTNMYMRRPQCQHFFLKLRSGLFILFRIKSDMLPITSYGACRILYETGDHKLTVRVESSALKGKDDLILLNEASGRSFTRFRINGHIYDRENIPAWMTCPIDTVIENPTDCIAFSISAPAAEASSGLRFSCGREVGHALNWSGIALTSGQQRFCYFVNFFDLKI